MRTLAMLAAALVFVPQSSVRSAGPSAACTTATAACTEWVALGAGGARSLVYRTRSLDERNANVRRALIMVHGTNRNADHYFSTAVAAAFLAGALDDSVVISPRIASAAGSCHDTLAPNEVSWSCTGDSWRSGGTAASHPDLTSFDFVDAILKKLANKSVFPNMRAIVVAGHSAGGQFVARYQMANRVHDTLGVPVSYAVANPSSYAWPDATRPLMTGDAAPDAAKGAWESEKVHTNFTYGPFDVSACANYDRWPAGLEQRTSGYTKNMTDDQLKTQLVSRKTTFLLSQVDVLPLGGFDSSCPAMAQGVTRRARGEAYLKYVNERLGATHGALIVPECGHNDRCVYTTDAVLPVIFPPAK
ncbi:MAG TPA: alpha/beta fold hydrolase [Vicinamibacterales bacterium]|nr:alpha/beta fold hydrolase [Vicinamibacterales bacterium]